MNLVVADVCVLRSGVVAGIITHFSPFIVATSVAVALAAVAVLLPLLSSSLSRRRRERLFLLGCFQLLSCSGSMHSPTANS